MTKRTCGECEHWRQINFGGVALGHCRVTIGVMPMWVDRHTDVTQKNDDATHCETFLLKQLRKDDKHL